MIKLNKDCFDKCQAISVDYAIMEKVCRNTEGTPMFVYPYAGTWCDVGSFHALHEHLLNNHIANKRTF